MMVSCTTTKYVPVETVKTEYINKVDSVLIHDSIYQEVHTKGDTVFLYKYLEHLKEVVRQDTIIRCDSIPVIVEVERQVITNKLNWWQNFLCVLGGISLFILGVIILAKLLKLQI